MRKYECGMKATLLLGATVVASVAHGENARRRRGGTGAASPRRRGTEVELAGRRVRA